MNGQLLTETRQFALEMGEYFSSIEESFQATLKAEGKTDIVGVALLTSVIASVLSVVPVIPLAVWSVTRLVSHGRASSIPSWLGAFPSFLFWWIVCAVLTISVAVGLNALDNRRAIRRKGELLNAPPMRFALCHAIVQEIDHYAKTRLPKFMERAESYWRKLHQMLVLMLNPWMRSGELVMRSNLEVTTLTASDLDSDTRANMYANELVGASGIARYRSVFPQIDVLRTSYSWFKLEPMTARIVAAFNLLPLGVTGRLKDKKDLPLVAAVLSSLAAYLYSVIPELSSTEAGAHDELKNFGEQSLARFAEKSEPLSPYHPEPRPLDSKEKVRSGFATAVSWTLGLFSHENSLARFSAWWLLAQFLAATILLLVWHYVSGLKFDSTLVALEVGTPLLDQLS